MRNPSDRGGFVSGVARSSASAQRVGRLGDKARIEHDIHGCIACDHAAQGPAISGSNNVFVNRRPVLRVSDRGIHTPCCGLNRWEAVEGSPTVFVNGRAIHRVGDKTRHCGGLGELIDGSDNVFAGSGTGIEQVGSTGTAYWYGTDTNTGPNGNWTHFYIGKVASGRTVYVDSTADVTDALSAVLAQTYQDSQFPGGNSLAPTTLISDNRFKRTAALSETSRNYAYAVMTAYYYRPSTTLTADQLAANATSWGRLQGMLAVVAASQGPYAAHIGGRTLFADIESESAPTFQTTTPNGTVNETGVTTTDYRRLTLNAWLDAVSGSYTPGIYTQKHFWSTYFGSTDWIPSQSFVLWHSMCPNEAGGTNPALPTAPVLAKLFGDSPPPVAVFGGQRPTIWQRYVGRGDYNVTLDDPTTGFQARSYTSSDTHLCGSRGGTDWIDEAEATAEQAEADPSPARWLGY